MQRLPLEPGHLWDILEIFAIYVVVLVGVSSTGVGVGGKYLHRDRVTVTSVNIAACVPGFH